MKILLSSSLSQYWAEERLNYDIYMTWNEIFESALTDGVVNILDH